MAICERQEQNVEELYVVMMSNVLQSNVRKMKNDGHQILSL